MYKILIVAVAVCVHYKVVWLFLLFLWLFMYLSFILMWYHIPIPRTAKLQNKSLKCTQDFTGTLIAIEYINA